MNAIKNSHEEAWTQATTAHPFIRGCGDGTVSQSAFDTWLLQDYLYVKGFLAFTQQLVAKATGADLAVFEGSVATIMDELRWFEELGKQRNLDVHSAVALPTTNKYIAFLADIGKPTVPFAIHAAAFYFVEAVYNSAWAYVLAHQGASGKFSIYASRWGSEDFTKYCEILENIANSSRDIYIAGHSEAAYTHIVSPLAKSIFDLEIEFWNMAQP